VSLLSGVAQFGRRWARIATILLPGRTGFQCQIRWDKTLNPDIKAGTWTAEEVSLTNCVRLYLELF
jgi:hypothetical protein